MRINSGLSALLATAAIGALVASPAQAIPSLSLSDGTNTVLVEDGQIGDLSGEAGRVGYAGLVGNIGVTISVGTSKPILGSASSPFLDLFSLSAIGGGVLTVAFSDTDFTGIGTRSFLSNVSGFTTGNGQLETYVDDSNSVFGMGTALSTIGFSGLFNESATATPTLESDPFSVTLRLTVATVGRAAKTLVNAKAIGEAATKVAEPPTLVLLGLGLLAVGFVYGRRSHDGARMA